MSNHAFMLDAAGFGERECGGFSYKTYQESWPNWDSVWGGKLYLSAPELNSERLVLPPHIIKCSKELNIL